MRVVFEEVGLALTVVLSIVSFIALFFLLLFVHMLLDPVAHVNLATRQLRIRGRVVPFEQIDRATIVVEEPGAKHRVLAIRFGTEQGPRTTITLRDDVRITLDPEERDTLIAVLERSSIRMPQSQYDPTGRFARHNFPMNLDRDAAIELVRHPPAPTDPLPVIDNGRYRRQE